MSHLSPVHVFTGPTLTAEQVHSVRPDAHVHEPVRHGDLIALDAPAGAVVVIVDGLYHQQVSVRHKEILEPDRPRRARGRLLQHGRAARRRACTRWA
ncbi:hypothetical protein G5V59_13740 [Nocardioides sp. W3-2-3]|uniref:hypothetical protein n=1 Tax=Nocardioides convexus TaxID=2712224 RepID=UPI0024188F60|nr:hypothetical protein [Nocardioides convexus]NHA00710.1 hypothetical protein [Nocardioides convexus]